MREPSDPLCPQPGVPEETLATRLARRRERLAHSSPSAGDAAYRYPIMAALVPVATSRGGEVAYPGDPMCLYAALSLNIARSVGRRTAGLPAEPDLDDVYPDWGVYPDDEYRRAAGGRRQGLIADNPTTDGKVFDPRVWDEQARERYVAEVKALRPEVVLLSAVSAGHRYALEMAELAKRHAPGCLVILGGRHTDETLRYNQASKSVDLAWCGTVEVIGDGRFEPVVDFLVSGDGAPGLDLLLQAVALCAGPEAGRTPVREIVDALCLIARERDELVGAATIVGLEADEAIVVPVLGRRLSSAEICSPYEAFSIRSRFDVFGGTGLGSRTAHMMTLDSCPFKCTFCSESIQVSNRPTRFAVSETEHVASRVRQLMSWGAEAVFFDDPVFWGGNWKAVIDFCHDLSAQRAADPADGPLEWGAQLTVDVVLNRAKWAQVKAGLDLMRESGCTYIYIGIESMADQVMAHVGKNLLRRNPEPWVGKVREALQTIKAHGIRVGSSVLFGLDGEDRNTIEETIEQIGRLIDDNLLIMASPNILTYHPGTAITAAHGQDRLDYHSRKQNRPPYTYFEEAYPEVVSQLLTEDDIWYIHETSAKRWGTVRNSAAEPLSEAAVS